MSRRVYENPPAVEAVCEFRFRPGDDWDPTTPFRLFDLLRGSYPQPLKQDLAISPPQGVQAAPTASFFQPEMVPRTELKSTDGARVLRVSPGVLSVSVLAPYPGWEVFRPQIAEALEAYLATGVGTSNIVRIGIRYVNRIRLPDDPIELPEYFTVSPPSPPGLPENLGAFLLRQELFYDDPRELLILTLASTVSGGELEARPEVILDLDAIQSWDEQEPLQATEALALIDKLRDRERDAFESCITDATRRLFGGT